MGRAGLPFHLDFVAFVCSCCVRAGPMNDRLECGAEDGARPLGVLCAPCYAVAACCCAVCSERCTGRVTRERTQAKVKLVERDLLAHGDLALPPAVMERGAAASDESSP